MAEERAPRPNILLIHTHDSGRFFGCYGRRAPTPNIDRLASEGIRFDQAFCPAPQCSPSRASLLTGLYPHRSGMLGLAHLGWRIHDCIPTLPRLLREIGYDAYLFGTQHEAGDGVELGYTETFVTKMPQRAHEVAPAVASFLSRRAADVSLPPFFLSVGFWETHRPFDEPVYGAYSPEEVEVPPYLPDRREVREDLAQFYGMLKAADEGVGIILQALHDTGVDEETLVVFTTDHGIAFPRAKGTLYDAGVSVALVMRWPRRIASGRVYSHLVSNVDLLPTLIEAAGGAAPRVVDGRSFLHVLRGGREPVRREAFFELTWHDRYAPVRGIRTERWKYIRHFAPGPQVYLPLDVHRSLSGRATRELYYARPHPQEELYDVKSDALEQRNLAGETAFHDVLAEMRDRVQEWMETTDDPMLHGPVPGNESSGWDAERKAGTFPAL